MAITLLNDDLINKIAAGEVIERPASIVKELIENSLDAKASKINIAILNGGKDYIEVEDNGIGLDKEEIPLAFLRHATSKIKSEDDLHNIYTMGFRGEALPSIAAVSQITIFSNQTDDIGVRAEIEGGVIKQLDNFACPKGTRIIVKNLFYNTPARKNFLKTTVTEGNAVYEMVNKYALARPDISFSFKKDNKLYYKTLGNGNIKDTVMAILGQDFAASLIEVDYQGEAYSLSGLISTPDFTRNNRKHQYFFVNSRPIRSSMLYKALDTSYKGLLISRENPVVILSLKLKPEDVDVNVHPQKTEVRFKNEKDIFHVFYEVIKARLTKVEYNPVHKWNTSTVEDNFPAQVREPMVRNYEVHNNSFNFAPRVSDNKLGYKPVNNLGHKPPLTIDIEPDLPRPDYKIIGQYAGSYILMEYEDALWLVDQHAAEERIIYAKLKKQYANNNPSSQLLAFPLSLELSALEVDIIMDNIETLARLGFTIELSGHNSIIIRDAPAIALGNEKELITEIIELLQDGKTIDIHDKALVTMSCKKAIKAGLRLGYMEMENIIEDLLNTDNYKNCPHGRPTLIKLSHYDIEQMFKR